jgi:hypothetical protein
MILLSLFFETLVQGLTGYSQTEGGNRLVAFCASHGLVNEDLLQFLQGRQSF